MMIHIILNTILSKKYFLSIVFTINYLYINITLSIKFERKMSNLWEITKDFIREDEKKKKLPRKKRKNYIKARYLITF